MQFLCRLYKIYILSMFCNKLNITKCVHGVERSMREVSKYFWLVEEEIIYFRNIILKEKKWY